MTIKLDHTIVGSRKWHEEVLGDELEQFAVEQLKSIGALQFGRTTDQGTAAFSPSDTDQIVGFVDSVPKLVSSRTPAQAE